MPLQESISSSASNSSLHREYQNTSIAGHALAGVDIVLGIELFLAPRVPEHIHRWPCPCRSRYRPRHRTLPCTASTRTHPSLAMPLQESISSSASNSSLHREYQNTSIAGHALAG